MYTVIHSWWWLWTCPLDREHRTPHSCWSVCLVDREYTTSLVVVVVDLLTGPWTQNITPLLVGVLSGQRIIMHCNTRLKVVDLSSVDREYTASHS